MKPSVIIVPGNGCQEVRQSNWYASMEQKLLASGKFSSVILQNMPDPIGAKESVWVPFIVSLMPEPESTIIIGHSSGAEAAMRILENYKLLGCVLVSACHTDLGDAGERAAGYYNRPWNWDIIKNNAKWILQYHSNDDYLIPRSEADFVAANICSEYKVFDDRSHFFRSKDVAHIPAAIYDKIM